ncbi:MAG: hypothetical protein KIT85_17005 [Pseudolabrys sp.]|nr:hypothetical protein [Pseudolabrys sp.]
MMPDQQDAQTQDVNADDRRSPFVRLTELLGDTPPGMPPINLSVGEPQHPVPPRNRATNRRARSISIKSFVLPQGGPLHPAYC